MPRPKVGITALAFVCAVAGLMVVCLKSTLTAQNPRSLQPTPQPVPQPVGVPSVDPLSQPFQPQPSSPDPAIPAQPPQAFSPRPQVVPPQIDRGRVLPELRATRPANELVANWSRELGGQKIMLSFQGTHLTGTATFVDGDTTWNIEFGADYARTSDGVLYGVLTSAGTQSNAEQAADELLQMDQAAQQFVDFPFSLRIRVDGDVLTIKDVRFAGNTLPEAPAPAIGKHLPFVSGRYKRVAEPPSNPVPAPPTTDQQFLPTY